MFTKYDPNHELILERNPHFKQWSADAQPDGYVDKIDVHVRPDGRGRRSRRSQNGRPTGRSTSPPADRLNELGTKYASQVHINTQLANWYLPMNVNIPPFNNKLARQAVNYAVDRNAAVRILGGPKLAIPSCQVLPAGLPGARRLLPVHEEPGREVVGARSREGQGARQAVGHRRREGRRRSSRTTRSTRRWACTSRACSTRSATRRRSRRSPATSTFTYIQNTKNKVQISVTQWYQDYPAPSDFLYVLLGCDSFHPGSDTSVNMAGFCNKKINADMKKALDAGHLRSGGRAQAVDEDRPRR